MEGYISAKSMGEKKAADDAFMDDVESSCVMEAMEV
jgi:hypothetical protein